MASERNISQCTMENSSLISRGLYYVVERFIGPGQIVESRRKHFEMLENYLNLDSTSPYVQLIRGSRGEGYAFDISDADTMFFDKGVIVLPESSLVFIWKLTDFHTIFRMEYSAPGFVKVILMESLEENEHINTCLVRRGSKKYLCSKFYRDTLHCSMNSLGLGIHGPCLTSTRNYLDFDFCFCLYSPFWPDQAMSFIPRSIRSGWPREPELIDIIKEGCIIVPINSKVTHYNDELDLEWRISFSLAEKKIMQSISRIQIIMYGLLKIVLNDVLKQTENIKDLFCSYHMKNALFWEISDGPNDWKIDNFFARFWMIFRVLKKWVRNGYCPHFFVPERNMFQGKIYGPKQRQTIEILESLSEKGVYFLLQCQSIEPHLSSIMNQPSLRINIQYVNSLMNTCRRYEMEFEKCNLHIALIFQKASIIGNTNVAFIGLRNTLSKAISHTSIDSIIKMRINNSVQYIATSYFETCASNRKFYRRQTIAIKILRKIKTFYLFGEFQIIKYLYRSKQYERAIGIISNIKENFGMVMYEWYIRDDIVHTDRQSGLSYEDIIKKRIVWHIRLTEDDTIEELRLECIEKTKCVSESGIAVPPLIFLNFLLLLSYNELEDKTSRNKILGEMYRLMIDYKDNNIDRTHRAISWEILGLCQQLCEQRTKAFMSYIKALLDENNDFKEATKLRLRSL